MVCTKVAGQSRHLGKGRGRWRPHSLSAGILQGFSHRISPSSAPSTRRLPRDLRHPSGTLKNRHLYILVSWVAAAVCPEENGQRKTPRGRNDLGGISLHLQTLPRCRVFLLHQVQEGNLRWISKALLWAKRAYLDLYWGNSTVSILLFFFLHFISSPTRYSWGLSLAPGLWDPPFRHDWAASICFPCSTYRTSVQLSHVLYCRLTHRRAEIAGKPPEPGRETHPRAARFNPTAPQLQPFPLGCKAMLKRRRRSLRGHTAPAGHKVVMVLVTRMGQRQGAGFQDLALLLCKLTTK